MLGDLVTRSVDLPSGELRLLQPRESAELPDTGPVEWAPIAPYWSVLWRSGVALARELDGAALDGLRVVELGCGLAAPSIVAARAGATVLATDCCAEALALVARNADLNDVPIETATVDWTDPGELVRRAPFDLALAADVLYESASADVLLSLLPRLAPQARLADPADRPPPRSSSERAGGGRSRPASATWSGSTGSTFEAPEKGRLRIERRDEALHHVDRVRAQESRVGGGIDLE